MQNTHLKVFIYVLIIVVMFTSSCNFQHQSSPSQTNNSSETLTNDYAKGFRIIDNVENLQLEVFDPWQKAENKTFRYILCDSISTNKNDLNATYIKIPVNKVVCMSTTHIAYINTLDMLSSIKAISGAALVNNETIVEMLKNKAIPDIGYEQNINFEKLVLLNPDLVFVYGIGAEVSGYVDKLRTLGINVVFVAEYLENHPLAKAEWIKFFAAFYKKNNEAKQIFDSIKLEYNELKNKITLLEQRPSVISTLPWNGTWYISGGQTYMGKLIEDAGGNFIWKNIESKESQPMDYELVFKQSINADIWINLSSVHNKSEILAIDPRLKAFKAFKTNQMYNNNARTNSTGGNDYWESGTMSPQVLLNDLASIFHPDILPKHKLYYYKKVE